MKYWRGYLTAGILLFFSWALQQFAQTHQELIDMVYPYVTRMLQTMLAEWSATVPFLLWQLLAVLLGLIVIASIVLMIVLRWNPIQWFGWVLAAASLVMFLQTGVYGLNYYAGPLADDIRLEVGEYTLEELEEAAVYYRDQADALAKKMKRDASGNLIYPDFETLAAQAGDGFESLTYERYLSVFAGSTVPVKKLGWADMYSSMGIDGFTFFLTAEAAVNPNIPVVAQPFIMCHEMAHRMTIANEGDANFAAFLACQANESEYFQYSAYFMAYRYCYNALYSAAGSAAAQRVNKDISDELSQDLTAYRNYYDQAKDEKATEFANTVNDTYIKASGDAEGVASYGQVCDLLVGWHIQEVVLPQIVIPEPDFDPMDKNQVDVTDITDEIEDSETEPTEAEEE